MRVQVLELPTKVVEALRSAGCGSGAATSLISVEDVDVSASGMSFADWDRPGSPLEDVESLVRRVEMSRAGGDR